MAAPLLRIGVFYDGNYFFHVSNYYNYVHPVRRRISIDGLHTFIREYLANQEKTDERYCRIIDAHYFRGRLSSYEAEQSNRLLSERLFEDILMNEGVVTHYLPLRTVDGRKEEKGVDTWMALEAFELALHKKFDVLVLIACDGDFVPLVKKLNAMGTKVMILGWDFEYTDTRNGQWRTTNTSGDLLREATYPVPMHALIDNKSNWKKLNLDTLFVPVESKRSMPASHVVGLLEKSQILSLKEGYGFIDKPPSNLFFHWSDVVGTDFNDLLPGDRVSYVMGKNERGQDVAQDVRVIPKEEE